MCGAFVGYFSVVIFYYLYYVLGVGVDDFYCVSIECLVQNQ